jgi:hypothetical protein
VNVSQSVSHQSLSILVLLYIYKQCNMVANISHALLHNVTRNCSPVSFSSALVVKFCMLILLIECYHRNFHLNFFMAEKIRIILCMRFGILIAQLIDRWVPMIGKNVPPLFSGCNFCTTGPVSLVTDDS